MLTLATYISKISQIQWYIKDSDVKTLSNLFHVDFESHNQYYTISKVHYSPYDILLALEDINFEAKKINDDLKIRILKI